MKTIGWVVLFLSVLGVFSGTPKANAAGIPCVQGGTCRLGSGTTIGGVPQVLNKSTTYFVDPTGNDSNACTSAGTAACATIQGAYNKKPKTQLNSTATLSLACGTYSAGAFIEGDEFIYNGVPSLTPSAAQSPQLIVTGTMQNATLSTGPNTGTLTSATQGGSPNSTWGTFTLAAAGWTVNNLAGKFIQITAGTDVGETRVIVSNTATVGTITGSWAIQPDATSQFAIVTPCVTVNDGLSEEQSGAQATSPARGPLVSAAFIVREPYGPAITSPTVTLQWMNISASRSGDGVAVEGTSNVLVQNNVFSNTTVPITGTALLHLTSASQLTAISNVFNIPVIYNGILASQSVSATTATSGASTPGFSSLVARYNSFLMSSVVNNSFGAISVNRTTTFSFQNSIQTGSVGIGCDSSSCSVEGDQITVTSTSGVALDCNGSQGRVAQSSLHIYAETLTGGGGSSTALDSIGGAGDCSFYVDNGNLTISGFGVAYHLPYQNVRILGEGSSLPAPSGSTTADIQFGLISQNFTWAQFTGQVPHIISDQHGNVVDNGDNGVNNQLYVQGNTYVPTVTGTGSIGTPTLRFGSVSVNNPTCSMSASTSCTATVNSGSVCSCWARGSNVSGGATACGVSGTTATCTAAAANSNTYEIWPH